MSTTRVTVQTAEIGAMQVNERGDALFTVSDPASGRGDGACQITDSFYNRASGEWHAAMRFPLPDQRGVMILRLRDTPSLDLDTLLTIEVQPTRIWE